MEYEPYVRDMLEAFMGNRFKAMLEILERNSVHIFWVIYECVILQTNSSFIIRIATLSMVMVVFDEVADGV